MHHDSSILCVLVRLTSAVYIPEHNEIREVRSVTASVTAILTLPAPNIVSTAYDLTFSPA